MQIGWDDVVVQLGTAIAGAFGGAWFAFRLQKSAYQQRQLDQRVSDGNKLLFSQVRQVNSLVLAQQQLIDPVREHPGRHVAMLPYISPSTEGLHVDLESASFLLSSGDHELLLDLAVEQERYETALLAMQIRGRVHLEEVQPKLEKAGFQEGKAYSQSDVENALGVRLERYLKRLTDESVSQVDATVKSLTSINHRVFIALKRMFPGHGFVRVMTPDDPGSSNAAQHNAADHVPHRD